MVLDFITVIGAPLFQEVLRMKLCYDCLDQLDAMQRSNERRTFYGEICDRCRRIETDNPVQKGADSPSNRDSHPYFGCAVMSIRS